MARNRPVHMLVLIAIMGVMLMACEEIGEYTLTITGPDEMKASEGARFTGTVTGVTPIVGQASYWWYLDANGDEWPQQAEWLRCTWTCPPTWMGWPPIRGHGNLTLVDFRRT